MHPDRLTIIEQRLEVLERRMDSEAGAAQSAGEAVAPEERLYVVRSSEDSFDSGGEPGYAFCAEVLWLNAAAQRGLSQEVLDLEPSA